MSKRRKILVVDDERDIVDLLRYNLEKEGFEVMAAFDGEEALRKIEGRPDLVLLDVMLPGMDGFEVCRGIRSDPATHDIPVLMLTARSNEVDEIVGLEIGADDYIMKPISPRKLLARVKAALRRAEQQETGTQDGPLAIEGVRIDPARYRVEVDGRPIAFARREFDLLHFLIRHQGKVFSREALLDSVWGSDANVVDRTVDVHVRRIREKLGPYEHLIETVKGVGYRFRE